MSLLKLFCSRRSMGLVCWVLVLALAAGACANVKLPSVIGDNMVLQQGMDVPLWGWEQPGQKVTVKGSWGGETRQTTADADGKWMVKIKPPAAGGPYEIAVTGQDTVNLKNVLCGEVWVCSGQSNMEFALTQAANGEAEIEAANYPHIHLFTVQKKVSQKPMKDCKGKWLECSPHTAWGFSAVGYFFGRELYKQLNVPIGLIHTSWGGTLAEAWTSKEYLQMNRDFKPILERYKKALEVYPKASKRFREEMKKFEQTAAKLKAEGKRVPRRPRFQRPMGPDNQNSPSGLYNGMLAPIIPYGIAGVIWYQGESNASRAYQYRQLFPTMIKCWRDSWRQGDFPFLFVQLANFMKVVAEPTESEWAELREAQLMTLSLPRTGMAVIIDIGQADNIHPTNKQDVGKRLALWALAKTYGKDIVYSGPIYSSMDIKDNRIILHFKHTGGGLKAKDGPLKGFAIAGADRKFVWADAKIEGDTVVVSSDKVKEPVAVRYAWANNPVCNLYNAEGLPASPFRTDIWPGLTAERR